MKTELDEFKAPMVVGDKAEQAYKECIDALAVKVLRFFSIHTSYDWKLFLDMRYYDLECFIHTQLFHFLDNNERFACLCMALSSADARRAIVGDAPLLHQGLVLVGISKLISQAIQCMAIDTYTAIMTTLPMP